MTQTLSKSILSFLTASEMAQMMDAQKMLYPKERVSSGVAKFPGKKKRKIRNKMAKMSKRRNRR